MIGTPITIQNHETGRTIVVNDHATDRFNVIALQSFPTFEPEMRANNLFRNGAHGEFRLPHYYSGISVVLQGIIVGESEANVWDIKERFDDILALSRGGFPDYPDDLAVKPLSSSTVRLSFTNPSGENVFLDCSPIKAVSYDRPLQRECQLSFQVVLRAQFPYLLINDSSPVVETGNLSEVSEGFKLNSKVPFELGNDFITDVLEVTMASEAFGIVTMNASPDGVIINPKVTNITNGSSTRVRRPLSGAGNQFIVDGLQRTAVDQSGRSIIPFVEGGFIYLNQGVNELVYSADTLVPYTS
jgi:hypothetical protein